MKSLILLLALTCTQAYATLTPLSDREMSEISARGLDDLIEQAIRFNQNPKGEDVAVALMKSFNPVLFFLDADITLKDVVYDASLAKTVLNPNGTITLTLPTKIGEMTFANIRPAGSNGGPSMGTITIKNIDFTGTTITIGLTGMPTLPVTVTPH
jgi:hypothetical protein